MKPIRPGLMVGFSWKRGFGLGFRIQSPIWNGCDKILVLHIEFANIELLAGFHLNTCTCKVEKKPSPETSDPAS